MHAEESELEMVRRHVREGVNLIAEQRARIERLRAEGLSTEDAEAILLTFETVQQEHEAHLARLQIRPETAWRPPGEVR